MSLHRSRSDVGDPRTVLVVGAEPIGLLAALVGKQLGGDVHVLDRATSGLAELLRAGH